MAQFKTHFQPGDKVCLKANAEEGWERQVATIETRQEKYDGMYYVKIDGEDDLTETHEDGIEGPFGATTHHYFKVGERHFYAAWNESDDTWCFGVQGEEIFPEVYDTLDLAKEAAANIA